MKRILLLFIFGAIGGSLLDSFHTHGGVAFYANPHFFKISMWSPLILGMAALVIGVSHTFLHSHVRHLKPALIFSFICFVFSYALTAYWKVGNETIALVVGALFLLAWGLFDRSVLSLVLALATGLVGSAMEGLVGRSGFFVYTHPDFWNVPFWLAPLYANASLAVGDLGRVILTPKR